MNIQEYISSGIIESYVLGLASREEQLEFEQLCATHIQIREAKEAFEISLEKEALHNAIAVPVAIKQKIWTNLQLATIANSDIKEEKIKNEQNQLPVPVKKISIAKYAAAAAVVLLLGSTALNFYFYTQYQSSIAKYETLFANTQQVATQNKAQQVKLDYYESSIRLMNDSNMTVVALKGRPISPASLTIVYWDKQSKDVYVHVNNLPQPSADKQYQLWAIVDGKPVDAGVFDIKDAEGLTKMKNIPRAQAFAITLETKGGSASPTLTAMYVMGAI